MALEELPQHQLDRMKASFERAYRREMEDRGLAAKYLEWLAKEGEELTGDMNLLSRWFAEWRSEREGKPVTKATWLRLSRMECDHEEEADLANVKWRSGAKVYKDVIDNMGREGLDAYMVFLAVMYRYQTTHDIVDEYPVQEVVLNTKPDSVVRELTSTDRASLKKIRDDLLITEDYLCEHLWGICPYCFIFFPNDDIESIMELIDLVVYAQYLYNYLKSSVERSKSGQPISNKPKKALQ